ncbi:TPA: hypothetical protein DIC38_00840 [Candidatus Nomurabacteria bacterium]|nr:hypothetical protein [Candidatus Nomurabacteria bacterium]
MQIITPLTSRASVNLNWDNPNSGRNPYKFKLSDYLNSNMMMQVVGCTGVVDKVTLSIGDLASGDLESLQDRWTSIKRKTEEVKKLVIETNKALSVAMVPKDPGPALTDIATDRINETVNTKNEELQNAVQKLKDQNKSVKMREECLNGIAYTLAKNQLVAMTKSTMNWVATGFDGDPMYVRNMQLFVGDIESRIMNAELEYFQNANPSRYPYGRDFARYYYGAYNSEKNFRDSMSQTLTRHLTNGKSIEDYTYDFSAGGWDAWLGLTQESQNNPIGYAIETSNYISNKQQEEIENTKQELTQNNGIISQRVCKVTSATKKLAQKEINKREANQYVIDAQNKVDEAEYYYEQAGGNGNDTEELQDAAEILANARIDLEKALAYQASLDAESTDAAEGCDEWEIVTPGSFIQDKISTYLNTPETQLEMADTINDVLNVVFAKLIDKLRIDGLTGLGYSAVSNSNYDWPTSVNISGYDSSGNQYGGEGISTRNFDLTKDLGNTYNHSDTTNLGTWDASINKAIKIKDNTTTSLVPGKGQTNSYYTVTVAGKTKLFDDDLGWEVGDRAFFNGISWQNWKKDQTSPIINRGIIQIQQDYLVVAKELLKILPGVMPALGELDYCIPGPNPNWEINMSDNSVAFFDFVSELKTTYKQADDWFEKDSVDITWAGEDANSDAYKNYRSIFANSYLSGWKDNWTSWSLAMNTKIMNYIDVLANGEDWTGEKGVAEAEEEIGELISNIVESFSMFKDEYGKTISDTYGTIQQEYFLNEKTNTKTPNNAYIPMAKEGLTLTKKITDYNNEVSDSIQDLKNTMGETDSTISKLEKIRSEVGKIIKAAQDRRDETITIALNAKGENFTTNTAYKIKYQVCLNEENIDYLKDYDLTQEEENRCDDRIDNDFDGLIDSKDPDCSGSGNTNTERDRRSGGNSIYNDYYESDQPYINTDRGY